MIFIGIDPGESGGVAIVDGYGALLFSAKLGGMNFTGRPVSFEKK